MFQQFGKTVVHRSTSEKLIMLIQIPYHYFTSAPITYSAQDEVYIVMVKE